MPVCGSGCKLLIPLVAALCLLAGDPTVVLERAPRLNSEIERDRALKVGFEAALAGSPDVARRYLPAVIDRPWIGEVNFRAACALAQVVQAKPARNEVALSERLVLAAGLRNPALALRESGEYLPLTSGRRLFEQFVLAAPEVAMGMASGTTQSARELRELLSGAGSPQLAVLARLAGEPSLDLARRSRMAILAGRIAGGEVSFDSASRIADDTPRFFATVLDTRTAAGGADAIPLNRALEHESLLICRAAQDNMAGLVAKELARFRARDLYVVLALGRAEATPPVFSAIFDRLLVPKLKAAASKGDSLPRFLDRTKNWGLRDFAAGALAARRFDVLLSIIGREIVDRLARRIDEASDPLREAMRLAEVVDAVTRPELRRQMVSIVSEEFARCRAAGKVSGATIYGLLAARLSVDGIAGPYLPFFKSSETLDTALLFDRENNCIQRYFFYDDDDGVESFDSFRASYRDDPAWKIEDRGEFVRVTGQVPGGRRIEIFANVPADIQQPGNRAKEGEAQRRQQTITAVLNERRLVPSVIVHRGHSYWVERTLTYVAPTARLVILGSCGGTTELRSVIEASHDAQVIATRGIGATDINDGILKSLNDRILRGERAIDWSSYWAELRAGWGGSTEFGDYVAPNQDAGAVFLRAYYRYLDASN